MNPATGLAWMTANMKMPLCILHMTQPAEPIMIFIRMISLVCVRFIPIPAPVVAMQIVMPVKRA